MRSFVTMVILVHLVIAPRERSFDQIRAIHANVDKNIEYVRPGGIAAPSPTVSDLSFARWTIETRDPAIHSYGSLGLAVTLWRASEFRGLALRDWLKIPSDRLVDAHEIANAFWGNSAEAVCEFLRTRRLSGQSFWIYLTSRADPRAGDPSPAEP